LSIDGGKVGVEFGDDPGADGIDNRSRRFFPQPQQMAAAPRHQDVLTGGNECTGAKPMRDDVQPAERHTLPEQRRLHDDGIIRENK